MSVNGKKVEYLLRSWGFGDNVVKQFEDEEIDEEAFECLDRPLIQQLFKTVGAQAKFLKHYNTYLKDNKERNNGSPAEISTMQAQPPPLQQLPLQQSPLQHPALHQSVLQQSNLQHPVNLQPGLQQSALQHPAMQQSSLQQQSLQQSSLQQQSLQQSTLQQSQLPTTRVKTETEVEGADGQIITIVGYESLASCSSWTPLPSQMVAENGRPGNFVSNNRNADHLPDVFRQGTEASSSSTSRSPIKSPQSSQAPSDSPDKRMFPFHDEGSSSNFDRTKKFCYSSVLDNDDSSNSGAETSMQKSFDSTAQGGEDWPRAALYAVSADREQLLESCIPKTWSEDLQIAIERDALSAIQQNEIVRRIADRMMAEGLKGDANFRDVAHLAISRIPCLGSKLAGSVGLVSRLKACVKNKTHYAKRRARKEGYSTNKQELSHDDAASMMRALMDQNNPPLNQLKVLLQICRKGRLSESRTHLPSELLHRYPALRRPDLILWEFEEIAHYKTDDLRARWLMAIPKIQRLLLLAEDDGYTLEKATISILLKIEEYFTPRGKCKGPIRNILSIYPEDVTLSDIIPADDSPPCLVVVGDTEKDNLQVTVFVNKVVVFVGNAIEALLVMIALYWVFSVEFAPSNRVAMVFLNAVLMPTQMANDIVKYRKVLSALEEMEKL